MIDEKNGEKFGGVGNNTYLCGVNSKMIKIMASVYTPKISSVDALWALIQAQTSSVRETLYKRVIEAEEKRKTQQQEEFVRKSLTKAFSELNEAKDNLEQLPNARDLFEIMDKK